MVFVAGAMLAENKKSDEMRFIVFFPYLIKILPISLAKRLQ